MKDLIEGHAVEYPAYFLNEEKLGQNFLNSEILVPEITFVWLVRFEYYLFGHRS